MAYCEHPAVRALFLWCFKNSIPVIQSWIFVKKNQKNTGLKFQNIRKIKNISKFSLIISTEFSYAYEKFKFRRGDKELFHIHIHATILFSMASS